MKIFVTNLARFHDRRRHMAAQLDRLGLDYEIVRGVVGANLTDAEVERACDMDVLRRHSTWFGRGAIGCTLTCQAIYQDILERQLTCALYLEDDTILPVQLRALLDAIERRVVDGEVILLHYASSDPLVFSAKSAEPLHGKHAVVYPMDVRRVRSGAAFVVTASAAQNMLRCNVPIKRTPDCWGDFYAWDAISRVRCVHPMPITSAYFPSTIGYASRVSFFAPVVSAIEALRLRLLDTLLRSARRLATRHREPVWADEESPQVLKPKRASY